MTTSEHPDNDPFNAVAAVQVGESRVEYRGPDFTWAYAALAPLVTEAFAFLQAGEELRALKSLVKAKKLIERVGNTGCCVVSPPIYNDDSEPKSKPKPPSTYGTYKPQ